MINEKGVLEQTVQLKKSQFADNRFTDGVAAVETLIKTAPKVGEWIPVSERLPESGELVLCTADDKISQAVYVFRMGKDGKWCDFDGYEVDAAEITAWQPLPESYKGESV